MNSACILSYRDKTLTTFCVHLTFIELHTLYCHQQITASVMMCLFNPRLMYNLSRVTCTEKDESANKNSFRMSNSELIGSKFFSLTESGANKDGNKAIMYGKYE